MDGDTPFGRDSDVWKERPVKRCLLPIWFLLFALALPAWAEKEVQVRQIEAGMGPAIESGQKAVITYELRLATGQEIEKKDSTHPFSFVLGGSEVIPGLSEGVQGMKVDELREITVPPNLGYGDKDMGAIPPSSTLIFKVRLLEIEDGVELSERMQSEDFLKKRHANDLTKPAMFEYLIRDFFTKPWRYQDGHLKIWRANGKLALVIVVLLIAIGFAQKRGGLK